MSKLVNCILNELVQRTTKKKNKNGCEGIAFLFAPPCGAQGQCRVHGQTFAGFSSPQTHMNPGKYVSMVHFPFSTKLWAFAPRILGFRRPSQQL